MKIVGVFSTFNQNSYLVQLIRQEKFQIKKRFLRLEPPIYWPTVMYANHYTNEQAEKAQKSFQYLTVMLDGSS